MVFRDGYRVNILVNKDSVVGTTLASNSTSMLLIPVDSRATAKKRTFTFITFSFVKMEIQNHGRLTDFFIFGSIKHFGPIQKSIWVNTNLITIPSQMRISEPSVSLTHNATREIKCKFHISRTVRLTEEQKRQILLLFDSDQLSTGTNLHYRYHISHCYHQIMCIL